MPRLHSLELLPDDEGQESVRAQWQALADAGLPSQLDHRGTTNAPHVSVVEADALPDAALDVARARLGGLLPVTALVGGVLLLGEGRVTLARPVQLADDVVRRVLAVRVQVPERRHLGWVPHLTLARRLERADVPRALEVLAGLDAERHASLELRLTSLRRWDPDAGEVHDL